MSRCGCMEKKRNLISDLISALNGGTEDVMEAMEILREIKDSGDPELIARAEYLCSVI